MSYDLYIQEVMKFRRALNLTAVADPEVFRSRFIEPSLALAAWLPSSGRLLDIGSGMGIPGVPLLIAQPGLVGILVERRKKRAEFLRHLIRKLHLNAEVYDADINDLPPLNVDACVARAVADEAELLRMCSPHVRAGSVALLPVPAARKPAAIEGWQLVEERDAHISGDGAGVQRIRCYRFAGIEGGFT